MHEQALLTQAELAFIRHLHQQPTTPKPTGPVLLADAGKQLSELLAHCAAHEQLSIHAQIANQRLTFDLHMGQDAQNEPCLHLSAPQIFDAGPINRAWRSPLPQPVPLQQANAQPSDLWIHQLSMNGALVEYRASRQAPANFRLLLPLDEQAPIAVEGVFVRKTPDGLLAYQLQALEPEGDEYLRQFIYQQHRQACQPQDS
jgi:hypothetical protein